MVKKEDFKKCLAVFLVVTAIFSVLLVMQRSGHAWFRPGGFQTAVLCAFYGATLLWSLGLVGLHLSIAEGFLLLASVQMAVFQFILPPASAPDELAHIFTSYNYSNQLLGEPEVEDVQMYGYKGVMTIPARPEDVAAWNSLETIPTRDTYLDILHGCTGNQEEPIAVDADGRASLGGISLEISPVAYLPGILGMSLARILGLSGLAMLYFGRFFMGAAYIALCYFGIRKIPFAKSVLAMTALLPMSLHLAASYSYDSVLIGFSIFWIGMVFHYAYEKERLKWYDGFTFLAAGIMLSCGKGIYVLLLGLCLLIPAKKLGGKRNYALFLVGAFLWGIVCMWMNIGLRMGEYMAPAEETAYYTIGMILRDPFWFIYRSLACMWYQGKFYLFSMLGGHLGWLEVLCPDFMIWGVFLILVAAAIFWRDDRFCTKGLHRTLCVLSFLAIFAVCMVAAICWTEVGQRFFQGLQGRYLLPALPLVLVGLGGWKKPTCKWNLDRMLLAGMGVMNTMILINAFEYIATR